MAVLIHTRRLAAVDASLGYQSPPIVMIIIPPRGARVPIPMPMRHMHMGVR